MTQSSTLRAVGGLSVFAVAAGFAVALGAGTANAAEQSVSWSDGSSSYTRTISNVNPAGGEIITISTQFKRNYATSDEKITMVRDQHPACLTYVPDSAHINDDGPLSDVTVAADSVTLQGNPMTTVKNPFIPPAFWPTFKISYKVGLDCAQGVALATGLNYNGSLGAGSYPGKGPSITVGKNNTTTTLAATPSSVQQGAVVSLSATVAGGANGNTVEFYEGANKLGEGQLTAGVATFAWTPPAEGQFSVTAKFLGTTAANESVSTAQAVSVTPANVNTQTALTAPTTAVVGEDVTLTTTVTPATATGTVQFKDGDVNIGEPVTVANGTASITRRFDEASTHSFTAHFTGTGLYQNSVSAASELTVKDADFNTTTTVLEPVTATVGVPVNLAATVLPIPDSGQVEFSVDGVPVGTADVGTGDGVATLPHTFANVGTANVTAKFLGSTGFTTSTSAGFSVTVKAPEPSREATTTALAVSGPSVVGQAMTFKATVAPAGAGGTVQFKAGTTEIGGPVAVVDGVATTTHTFDTAGTYGITAVFTGGAGYQDSVSGPTVIGVTEAGPGTPSGGSLASLFNS
ncbi:Ig-like domain-containing protein [Rhodococcus kronopolitis]|uniref:Ig-like domain-containing protein n=1 Tax=Rhodococcus kronopolitis TaxID=1460226 RepID=A0ABV9FLJ1_9NOCA